MIYKASLDKMALIITSAVTILFALIIFGQYVIIRDAGNAIPIYTTIGLSLIYLLAFVFRPIDYVLTADEVMIRRLFLSVKFKKEEIESVELIDEKTMSGAVRTFGVGGLFGYYGNFANFSLGSMTWYATRKDTAVLIKLSHKKIILTPDDPTSFVNHLNL